MKIEYSAPEDPVNVLPGLNIEVSTLDLLALLFGKVYDLPGLIMRRRGWR